MREARFSGTRVGTLSGKRLRETQRPRLLSLSTSTQMSRSTFQALTLLSDTGSPQGVLANAPPVYVVLPTCTTEVRFCFQGVVRGWKQWAHSRAATQASASLTETVTPPLWTSSGGDGSQL